MPHKTIITMLLALLIPFTAYAQEPKLENAEAYYKRGGASADKGEFDRAIADFDQAIKLKPKYAEAYYWRGLAYLHKGNLDRALTDFNRAIKNKPQYAEAYTERGNVYGLKSDYKRSLADHDRAIRLKPDLVYAYNNRGLVYLRKQDYDRAIADFNQAIKLNPDYAGAYTNRGNAYTDKRNYEQAIADYDQAIRLQPNLMAAYYHRAQAYLAKGKQENARSDLKKVLNLTNDPPIRQRVTSLLQELDAEAHIKLADALRQQGKLDEAIAEYQAALRINPPTGMMAYAHYNLGTLYDKAENLNQAIEHLEASLRYLPQDTTWNAAAWLYATAEDPRLRNPKKAIEYAKKAVEASQGFPAYLDTLAEAYYANREYDRAIQTIKKAITLMPDWDYAKEQLEKFEQAKRSKGRR